MKYTRNKLNNGIELVHTYIPESTSVSVFVIIKAGSSSESIPGLAHFIEHVVFKGTSKRPNAFLINQEIEQVGGFLNAATSQEFTEFYAKIPYEYAEKGYEVLSDILKNSTFDELELEKEKDVVIEEINMYSDMPVRNVSDSFYSQIWRHHPLGRAILGSEESVKSISREDVVNCVTNWYAGDNMIISVAGNISVDDANKYAEKYFSDFAEKSTVLDGIKIDSLAWFNNSGHEVEEYIDEKVNIRREVRGVKQMHLCFGYEALPYINPDIKALEVGSALLAEGSSSYLWQKIREEMGAAYYLDSEIDAFKKKGIWYIHAGVDESKIAEVIKECFRGIKKAANGDFTNEELYRAKEYLKGEFKMNLEGSEEYARYAGHEVLENGFVTALDEETRKIDKVTMEDISRVFSNVMSGKLFFNSLTKYTDLITLREILES